MAAEGLTPAATSGGRRRAIIRRSRHVIPLVIALLVIFVASGSTQTVTATGTATATCGSVIFDWSLFSASGSGNGGLNTPAWMVLFKPTRGAPLLIRGTTSFPGSTSSLTVPLPRSAGIVTASSSWTSAETRGSSSGSGSTNLTIANCPSLAAAAPAPVVAPTPSGGHTQGSGHAPGRGHTPSGEHTGGRGHTPGTAPAPALAPAPVTVTVTESVAPVQPVAIAVPRRCGQSAAKRRNGDEHACARGRDASKTRG